MDTKNIFQPNKNKVLMSFGLYLIIGAVTWVPLLSQVIASGFSNISNVGLPIFEIIFSLVAAYTISCYFVTYFKKDELRNLPLVVRFLAFYLFYNLLGALFIILKNLRPSIYSSFISEASYRFGGNYALSVALLIASIVFLIIKVDKNFLLASSYFLFLLINPYDHSGNIIFSPAHQGPLYGHLLGSIISLTQGDIVSMFYGLVSALFPLAILVYLFFRYKNVNKPENTMLAIIVISYFAPRIVSIFL
jgi:hypothetical protein